jgi:hypothetical protein
MEHDILNHPSDVKTISADKFWKDDRGISYLDIRLNINKNLSETINPVQITFHSIDVNSTDAQSIANDKVNILTPNKHTPEGNHDLENQLRNFYFTQVAPDAIRYPKVYFDVNSSANNFIRTPLSIDIFCNAKIAYCQETNLTNHAILYGSPRIQDGWYISKDHNLSADGVVQSLNPNTVNVTITPSSDMNFTDGRNGILINEFNSCNNNNKNSHITTIEVIPDDVLKYHPTKSNGNPEYTIECGTRNQGTMSGVGSTGNRINTNANTQSNSKMSW